VAVITLHGSDRQLLKRTPDMKKNMYPGNQFTTETIRRKLTTKFIMNNRVKSLTINRILNILNWSPIIGTFYQLSTSRLSREKAVLLLTNQIMLLQKKIAFMIDSITLQQQRVKEIGLGL